MALINENRKPLDIELMTGKKQTPEEKEKETTKVDEVAEDLDDDEGDDVFGAYQPCYGGAIAPEYYSTSPYRSPIKSEDQLIVSIENRLKTIDSMATDLLSYPLNMRIASPSRFRNFISVPTKVLKTCNKDTPSYLNSVYSKISNATDAIMEEIVHIARPLSSLFVIRHKQSTGNMPNMPGNPYFNIRNERIIHELDIDENVAEEICQRGIISHGIQDFENVSFKTYDALMQKIFNEAKTKMTTREFNYFFMPVFSQNTFAVMNARQVFHDFLREMDRTFAIHPKLAEKYHGIRMKYEPAEEETDE